MLSKNNQYNVISVLIYILTITFYMGPRILSIFLVYGLFITLIVFKRGLLPKYFILNQSKLFLLLVIALLSVILGNTYLWSFSRFIKDLNFFLLPIILYSIGSTFYLIFKDNGKIFYIFINSCTILASIMFFKFILYFIGGGLLDAESIRSNVGLGYSILPIGFFTVFYNKEFGLNFSSKKTRLILLIMGFTILISFSRTDYLCFIICGMIFSLDKRKRLINKSSRLIIGILFILSIVFFILIQTNNNLFFDKIMHSFNEINSSGNWYSYKDIVHNWRGYEVYMARQQFINSNFTTKLLGSGLGSGIYVGDYSSLLNIDSGYIPYLHNGYFTILIKSGIFGLLVYIVFLSSNIFCKKNIFPNMFFYKFYKSVFLVIVVNTFFTMGLFVSSGLIVLCIYTGYIYQTINLKHK